MKGLCCTLSSSVARRLRWLLFSALFFICVFIQLLESAVYTGGICPPCPLRGGTPTPPQYLHAFGMRAGSLRGIAGGGSWSQGSSRRNVDGWSKRRSGRRNQGVLRGGCAQKGDRQNRPGDNANCYRRIKVLRRTGIRWRIEEGQKNLLSSELGKQLLPIAFVSESVNN